MKRALFAIAWASFVLVATHYSTAHEAIPTATQPLGWQYDYSCCNLLDCSQSAHGDIKITEYGYLVVNTKEVIPWGDKRIKRSRDEYYHRCVPGGNVNALRSLCLYVPDQAG